MDISKVGSDKIAESQISGTRTQSSKATRAKDVDSTAGQELSKLRPLGPSESSEKVNWSPDAEIAQEALALAKNTGDARADKIAHLKEAIKNGTYKPDARKIADRMIQSSLEEDLLTRKS
jgi:flagellar biosynthesis anti-sigma factor FlgM